MPMRVIGYRDLRPVDWLSGKRMPLSPGEGHTCDRCSREHAVVYELLDEDTGKTYSVGSGCAKQAYGFDVERDEDAKQLVKTNKKIRERALNEIRMSKVLEAADIILNELELRLPVPEPILEVHQPDCPNVIHVGDSVAWINFRSEAETIKVATTGWFENRIKELTPPGWDKISVAEHPARPANTTMAQLLMQLVKRRLPG